VTEHKVVDTEVEYSHADHEQPSDWGWHAKLSRPARIGGWASVILLVLMMTSTHYNESGTVWLGLIAVVMLLVLVLDMARRKLGPPK
jgi:hypothetical protein